MHLEFCPQTGVGPTQTPRPSCPPAKFMLTSCRLWENTAHVSCLGVRAFHGRFSEPMAHHTDAVLSPPRSLAVEEWSLRTVRTVVRRHHISNRIAPRCRLETNNPVVWRAHIKFECLDRVLSAPQTVGGALVIESGAHLFVDRSTFDLNFGANDTDSSGIAVLGGWMGCGSNSCLAVCTTCRDAWLERDDDVVSPPSPSPTPQLVRPRPHVPQSSAIAVFGLSAACVLAVLCVVVTMLRLSRCDQRMADGAVGYLPRQQATQLELMRCQLLSSMDDADSIQSVDYSQSELVRTRLISVMRESPASIFAVDHDKIILFWSPGASAADLVVTLSSGPANPQRVALATRRHVDRRADVP